ncbi:CGNR zinc finger domain-containing protein [Microbacterium lushaniae]|uniref:LacI family DNA-binding transcriptional regulator n=1 Tax=Microbacterium lushaniae TaxID=2614639 RepID=A0A5J6L511_9MICO|nr:LacI family DNA-binding transcriptional regulator [Microbacterium lushaniae]
MKTGADAVDAVPAAVRLVREFVNTVEWQRDADAWETPSDLAAWCNGEGIAVARELTGDDLTLARRIREGVREVLLAHAGHDAMPGALADLRDALTHVPLRMTFDAEGRPGLARGDDGSSPLAAVVLAIDTARTEGSWMRLKACSRDSCRWAYWDESRNRSGRWCSMAGCGNYVKMRRRNAPAIAVEDAIPLAGESPRMPRMIDVAARAGVSAKTVSNVITGAVNVGAATRLRVEAAIEELDYRPNLAARALRTGRNVAGG